VRHIVSQRYHALQYQSEVRFKQLLLNRVSAVQLVRGLILLNPTPFWTLFNSRAFAASGTVPLHPRATALINTYAFKRLAAPANIRTLLQQVYTNPAAIDDALVMRICASTRHPHAPDAFASIMLAPRGAQEIGDMLAEVVDRGTPACLLHGMFLLPHSSGPKHSQGFQSSAK
jgi:hypothetical protein